jgi:hypothetical protein
MSRRRRAAESLVALLLFRRFGRSQRGHPYRLHHARTIRRIGPGAVINMAMLNVSRITQRAGRVPKQHLLSLLTGQRLDIRFVRQCITCFGGIPAA